MSNEFIFCDKNNIIPKVKSKKSNKYDSLSNESTSSRSSEIVKNKDECLKCAPGKTYDGTTCFTLSDIKKLVTAYNMYYGDPKLYKGETKKHIKLSWDDKNKDERAYKKRLITELTNGLNDVCSDQMCWLRQKFISELNNDDRENIVNKTFRPDGPQGKFTWLNTINLDEVMKQYENYFKDFKYLGTVPSDFDSLDDEGYNLSKLDYKTMIKNGKTKYGVVINFDTHDQPGSHWVGMYIDFNTGDINYFDSYGDEPLPTIFEYMKNMGNIYKHIYDKEPKLNINKVRNQYKDSECGVYSINFIIRSLSGYDMKNIMKNVIDDDDINQCRDVYFNI
jgi:hypothetical protein